VISTEDLNRFAYDGNKERLEQDIQHFKKQGLILQREIEARNSPKFRVLSLTKDGKRFLRQQNRVPKNQALYDGFVKPRELAHDAELYRLYQKVAFEIERSGGTVRHVVLDNAKLFILKSNAITVFRKPFYLAPFQLYVGS
jgi:hypothetical protein